MIEANKTNKSDQNWQADRVFSVLNWTEVLKIQTNEPALLNEPLLVVQLGEFLPDRVDQLDLSSREAHQHRDHALAAGRGIGRAGHHRPEVVARRTRTLFRTKIKNKDRQCNVALVRA